MKFKRIINGIIFIAIFGISISQDFLPDNGSVLNYTQIFFRWPQIVGSEEYQIRLDHSAGFQIYNSDKNSIIVSGLDWGTLYSWQICGLDLDGNNISCYAENNFTTSSLPLNYPANVIVLENDNINYEPGITILDYESLNFSVALG